MVNPAPSHTIHHLSERITVPQPDALSWKVVRRPPRRAPPPPPPPKAEEPDPFSDEMTDYITLVDARPQPAIEIHIQPATLPLPLSPPSPSPPLDSASKPDSLPPPAILYQPPGLVLPPRDPAAEHAARLRFVAGTLMTRVHCHVRPLRRRPVLDPWTGAGVAGKRAYVRSGLSRVVRCEE